MPKEKIFQQCVWNKKAFRSTKTGGISSPADQQYKKKKKIPQAKGKWSRQKHDKYKWILTVIETFCVF